MKFFEYPPPHPISTFLAGLGLVVPLLVSIWFFSHALEGGIGSLFRRGVVEPGILVYGLLTLAYGVTFVGVLAWHRPWLYAISYAVTWTPLIVDLVYYGSVSPFAILWLGPAALGFPLWASATLDAVRGAAHWFSLIRGQTRPSKTPGRPQS